MSVNNRLKKLQGALYINLGAGEHVTIEHGGETLVIQMNGKKGSNQFSVGFKGPMSFKIQRQKNDEPRND
jgi:hypothetical protein